MISRKLLVWTIATVALLMGAIDGDNWVQVSMIYIGSEALINSLTVWKSKSMVIDPKDEEKGD